MKKFKVPFRGNIFLLSTLAVLVFGSCSPPDTFYTPLTESETLMFSDSLRDAIQLYDGNFFLNHQDKSRLEERIELLTEMEGEELDKVDELIEFFSLPDGILMGEPQEGTHWNYCEINRIREKDGNLLVQIRVHDKSFTFDYYEFLVERRKYRHTESLVISDYYSYNAGQWLSESIADMAQFLTHTIEDSSGQAEYGRAKDQVAADFQRGNFSLGERGYQQLSDEARKDKLLNRVRLQTAAIEGDSIYVKVLDEYRSLFPGDMSIFGLCVEHDYAQKDYHSILQNIRNYETALGGGDAYTYWMQGDVMVYLEQVDSAAYFLDKSSSSEPLFDPPLISRFYLQLDLVDYSGALKTFGKLEKLGYRLENLDLKDYPEFLNSKDFAEWAATSDPMPTGKQ